LWPDVVEGTLLMLGTNASKCGQSATVVVVTYETRSQTWKETNIDTDNNLKK